LQPVLHVLADGSRIRIRPIRPDDGPRLAVAVGRLSEESRRRRFLAAKPGLTAAELRYLTEVDGVDHLAVVALAGPEPGAPIVGVARCIRPAPGSAEAEFAIVVGDALQGLGLGRLLMDELASAASAAGIRRFSATTLADNLALVRLLDGLGGPVEIRTVHGGVRELVAELPDDAGARRFAA
jgi:GNAT superfamily N-acetyltransferase